MSGHSVCWRVGVLRHPGSNPAFSRGRQFVSFRFEYRLLVPDHRKIKNNKHVYCQSQVRKPNTSEIKEAECSLIIGTGCWIQVFSLILDGSVGLWWAFRLLGNRCLEPSRFESCIQLRKTTDLLSNGIPFACARESKLTTANMYIARAGCESQTAVKSMGLNGHSS